MSKSAIAVVGHIGPRTASESDTSAFALSALAALGQPTRLDIFRMLMRAEPAGLPAGVIAEQVGCAHNTLSTHLAILARAGLIRGARNGRSIVYRADVEGMRALVSFLVTDCCEGRPELCDLLGDAGGCDGGCAPEPRRSKARR